MVNIRRNDTLMSSFNVSQVQLLQDLFQCNFRHIEYPQDKIWMLKTNFRLFKTCTRMEGAWARIRAHGREKNGTIMELQELMIPCSLFKYIF